MQEADGAAGDAGGASGSGAAGWRARARDLLASLSFAAGLTRPRRAAAGRLTVATFHRVLPEARRAAYPYPKLVVTPEELAWLLDFLTREFDCGPLTPALERWRAGGAAGARPPLALTFDDGQLDNYAHARPVLARAGVQATFFVPVASVGGGPALWHDRLGFAVAEGCRGDAGVRARLAATLGAAAHPATLRPETWRRAAADAVAHAKRLPPEALAGWLARIEDAVGVSGAGPAWDGFMSWEQLATLEAEGHEIGCHGMTHALLPGCDDAQLARETADAREALAARLRGPADAFCYPNGDHDPRTVEAVRRAGFRAAVTTQPGTNPPGADPFRLRRCDMSSERLHRADGAPSPARVAWRLTMPGRLARPGGGGS